MSKFKGLFITLIFSFISTLALAQTTHLKTENGRDFFTSQTVVKLEKLGYDPSRKRSPEKASGSSFFKQADVRSYFVEIELPIGAEITDIRLFNKKASNKLVRMRRVYPEVHPNNYVPQPGSGWLAVRYDILEGTVNGSDEHLVKFILINWKHNWSRRVKLEIDYSVDNSKDLPVDSLKAKITKSGGGVYSKSNSDPWYIKFEIPYDILEKRK